MRFADINREEGNFALVLIVKLVEGGNLPPKWRSSVAAEDHDYGLNLVQLRKLNRF